MTTPNDSSDLFDALGASLNHELSVTARTLHAMILIEKGFELLDDLSREEGGHDLVPREVRQVWRDIKRARERAGCDAAARMVIESVGQQIVDFVFKHK